MIILSSTTDKLQVVLSANVNSNQLTYFTSFRQTNQPTDTEFTPDRTAGSTNNTTAVDMVGPPASGKQRMVENIVIYNSDAVTATVTIIFEDNTNDYVLHKATLLPSEALIYTDGQGWRSNTANGDLKTVIESGAPITSGSMNFVLLSSDVTNNNATANTMQDITGLSFSAKALSRYWFRMVINYTAAATTTGSRWSINSASGISELRYKSEYGLNASSKTVNEGLSSFDAPGLSNATSAAASSNIAVVEGIVRLSSDGTVIGRFASEVSSSAIVAKAGSILMWGEL